MTLLREATAECLRAAGRTADPTPTPAVVALWPDVHGLAKLRLEGPLREELGREEFLSLVDQVLEVQLSVFAGG